MVMAKKDEVQGVQCENADIEILRRQLARLENTLTEKFTEVKEQIGKIPAQQPLFPPPVEPLPQEPIEVNLPDNLAKSGDIKALTGMIQTLNGTVALAVQGLADIKTAFEAMPKPDVQSIAEKVAKETAREVVDNLTPKIDDSTAKAMRHGVMNAPGISLDDAASIHQTLKETNKRFDTQKDYARLLKVNRNFVIVIMVLFNIACLLGWGANKLWEERNELMRVEWLYRSVRSIINGSYTEYITGMEKKILSGTDEQRDSIKTETVNREETGIPFHNFQPHDDWKPEPPKPKTEKPNPKKEAEIDRFPLPHQRERRLTPGEIQAIKNMRADPNIPEDAKPELPEGYE